MLQRPNGSSATGRPPSPAFLSRALEHAQTLHERFFRNLWLPHLQLDELRTRLRSATQVLWLWLAIDPCTKLLPVLQLGPRTQNMAHLLIHSLRQFLAPGCLPLFTSDGLNVYFYALTAHFGHWLALGRRGRKARRWQRWHAAPGPRRSPPHNSWPISSGGELTIISCVPMHRSGWRSYSPENEVANW
jgi:transposase-like protein